MGKAILEKIVSHTGISLETPKEFNQEIAQVWRGKLEIGIRKLVNKMESLKELKQKLPEQKTKKKILNEKIAQVDEKMKLYKKNNKYFEEKKEYLELCGEE